MSGRNAATDNAQRHLNCSKRDPLFAQLASVWARARLWCEEGIEKVSRVQERENEAGVG